MGGDSQGKSKGKGKIQSKGSKAQHEYDRIEKRAEWLNRNVFTENPIDDDAIDAMCGMGFARAMELFKEVEEKADEMRHPGKYLKAAARRDGFGPTGGGGGMSKDTRSSKGKSYDKSKGSSKGAGGGIHFKVRTRAEWLNDKLFSDRPINERAMEALSDLGVPTAMQLFKEVEEMGDEVRNPSGYLHKAARDAGAGVAVVGAAPGREGKAKGKGGSSKGKDGDIAAAGSNEETRIEKRAQWLNRNVFADRPIDDDAICAMMGMGASRAMELFKEVEEKAESLRNPGGYLKKAARAEGFAPIGMGGPIKSHSKSGGKSGSKGAGEGSSKKSSKGAAKGDSKKRPAVGSTGAPPAKKNKNAAEPDEQPTDDL